VALATVVSTDGSAYRRPGAWMSISPGGVREGLLSGGCLEEDVAARAASSFARGTPELATYDTRQTDDLVWGLRMGCQGLVRILIEPLSRERLDRTAELFSKVRDLKEEAVLATAESGDRLLVSSSEILASTFRDVPEPIAGRAREILESGVRASAFESVGGVAVGFTPLLPRIRLVLCGAGEDAVPLAQLAGDLDWPVLVADHRPALARPDRFPGARVELLPRAADLAPLIGTPHSRVAAVVMSHNTERDVDWVAALLPLDLGYLGILGPKRRGEQVLRAAAALAGSPPRARRILAPIGLDIASETPREIAVSIVAEVSALLAGRPGGSLSGRETPIHRARGDAESEAASAPLDPEFPPPVSF